MCLGRRKCNIYVSYAYKDKVDPITLVTSSLESKAMIKPRDANEFETRSHTEEETRSSLYIAFPLRKPLKMF